MLISIVIPCYNEEEVLPETIKRLGSFITNVQHKSFKKKETFVEKETKEKTSISQDSLSNLSCIATPRDATSFENKDKYSGFAQAGGG